MSEDRTLRQAWTELYLKTLPRLARAHDVAQSKWPVTLDHCFARIILDNTVGEGRERWDKRLKRPAVKNMSLEQLKQAIRLGERIRDGKEDLVALNLQSLEVRGKADRKYKEQLPALQTRNSIKKVLELAENAVGHESISKRKNSEQDDADMVVRSSKKAKTSGKQATLSFTWRADPTIGLPSPPAPQDEIVDLLPTLMKIKSHPTLTPYRKRLYAALLNVPKGRHTTYTALSNFLGSSARAVGNGMRNNPFAPEVPCHRVLASDGSIGGFGGSWGVDGKYADKKLELLRKEGVKFDSQGKVRGPPFEEFVAILGGG